jgi:hypothetical protein
MQIETGDNPPAINRREDIYMQYKETANAVIDFCHSKPTKNWYENEVSWNTPLQTLNVAQRQVDHLARLANIPLCSRAQSDKGLKDTVDTLMALTEEFILSNPRTVRELVECKKLSRKIIRKYDWLLNDQLSI